MYTTAPKLCESLGCSKEAFYSWVKRNTTKKYKHMLKVEKIDLLNKFAEYKKEEAYRLKLRSSKKAFEISFKRCGVMDSAIISADNKKDALLICMSNNYITERAIKNVVEVYV